MRHRDTNAFEQATPMFEQLYQGAFLTTAQDDNVNTMTIAWGGIQILWGRPFYVVYVRYSRHTYAMLETSNDFTVSIPKAGTLKEELAYCGTKSGRDTDKIKDCGLTLVPAKAVGTPIIGECLQHYECKIRYRQAMEPNAVPLEVKQRHYPSHNYHMIYYGEIVERYETKGA